MVTYVDYFDRLKSTNRCFDQNRGCSTFPVHLHTPFAMQKSAQIKVEICTNLAVFLPCNHPLHCPEGLLGFSEQLSFDNPTINR
jgi:hypothetical protein